MPNPTTVLLVALASLAAAAPAAAGELDELYRLKDFTMHRVTSADPTGKNDDWRRLPPGETLVLADLKGSGCIVHLRDNITSEEPYHLQKHVLRAFWDGEESPSVEAPVGDFFAVGFGCTAQYSSALLAVTAPGQFGDAGLLDGTDARPDRSGAARNCYIPMPFARSARLTITNEGERPSQHWFEVNWKEYRKPLEAVGCFHAQYRQGTPPPEGPYLILQAAGRGHLVGCVLSVRNNEGGWWGEGDEIVEIDGRPAIHGTGSEDYFCQSYGLRRVCFPYFGVTLRKEPYTTAYRWHVPDPVPFERSIRFSIEHGRAGAPPFRSKDHFASVAYWYQTEPHAPFPKLPPPGERPR